MTSTAKQDNAAFLAEEREWFRRRLAEPELLEHAVEVAVDRNHSVLAVPTGKLRKAGYVPVPSAKYAQAVAAFLKGRPGFSNVRVELSDDPRRYCPTVHWGQPVPHGLSDTERGWLYGYSEAAIAEFLAEFPTIRKDGWTKKRSPAAMRRARRVTLSWPKRDKVSHAG